MTLKKLEEKMEMLRQEMYNLYLEDPQDPRVLKVSQSLDELLNEHHRLRNKTYINR